MKPFRYFLLASTFATSVASCAGDDDASFDVTEFCLRWAAATCSEETVSACQATDAEACRDSQQASCLSRIPADQFSSQSATACLDAVAVAYADADLSAAELRTTQLLQAPCDRLLVGPSDEGEPCSAQVDCNTPAGFSCVFASGSASQGTCQIPESVDPGRDCEGAAAVCTEGFVCNGDNCIAAGDPGDACVSDSQCAPGSFCGSGGVCTEALAVGTACIRDVECLSGVCLAVSPTEQVCTDRVRLARADPLCSELR